MLPQTLKKKLSPQQLADAQTIKTEIQKRIDYSSE